MERYTSRRYSGAKGKRLWSEELTSAHNSVLAIGNPLLTKSFEDLAFSSLGGNGTDISDNGGFDFRNSIGIGVTKALGGNTSILDKLNDTQAPYSPTNPLIQAQLTALKMGVHMHAMSAGIELKSDHIATAPSQPKLQN